MCRKRRCWLLDATTVATANAMMARLDVWLPPPRAGALRWIPAAMRRGSFGFGAY